MDDELMRMAEEITGGEYVKIGTSWAVLDGSFTSDQLRKLADLIDNQNSQGD